MSTSTDHPDQPPQQPDDEHRPERDVNRRLFLLAGAGAGLAAVTGLAVPIVRSLLDGDDAAASTGSSAAPAPTPESTTTTAPSSTTTSTAAVDPVAPSDQVSTTIEGDVRTVRSTGIPDHPTTGRYVAPVSAQDHELRMTTTPAVATAPTEVTTGTKFGVHVNGVPFDPATAGFFDGDPSNGWLQDATDRQLDDRGAHTQQSGAYHYHRMTDAWGTDATSHGPLVGWAADGFPVYLRFGDADPVDHGGR